ncbi:hypothetical protein [Burkholderia sp. MS455]|uniref:hypothetical protein n=1 Tax=Burkholderia sp. MS455 TaxID=2811788 RepID=UPI00195BCFDA|nr:hypothetical protein [Burkholderia sp. MS455]
MIGEVYEVDTSLIPISEDIEQVHLDDDELVAEHEVSLKVGGKCLSCRFYPIAASSVEGKAEILSGDWVAHGSSRQTASIDQRPTRNASKPSFVPASLHEPFTEHLTQ